MKELVVFNVVVFLLVNNVIYCEDIEKSTIQEPPPLVLVTLVKETLTNDEALTRLVRRTIFNGFEQGTTLRIIQPRKTTPATSKSSPEVIKLETIRSAIKKIGNETPLDGVILYVEHDLSLILSTPDEILSIFKNIGARILVSSDSTPCESKTTLTTSNGTEKYGNFAGFIGYKQELSEIFTTETSQKSLPLLLSHIYNDKKLRAKFQIELDLESTLFQTIVEDSSKVNLELKLSKETTYLFPTITKKFPINAPVHILQTNLCKSGNSYTYLNALGSYLTPTLPDDKLILSDDDEELPIVALAIFIERPTPFMEEFFVNIEELDYPKNRIDLFIHNHYKYNTNEVERFLAKNGQLYRSLKYIRSKERIKEWAARKMSVYWALEQKEVDYWFSVDSTAHLDDESTLRALIESNKLLIAPMLCSNTEFLPNICNWWGALNTDGFYAKSSDYDFIAEDVHKGIWNVPFVNTVYLVKISLLKDPETRPNFVLGMADADLAFAVNNRARGIFMHVTNEFHPGHLVINENYEIGHLHNDLYQIFDNRYDWENRYLHPNHSVSLSKEYKPLEPCQDVFWFPIVTPRFATEMIEEMEHYGQWADGSIEARGDLYPTVDIQMHEIGFNKHFHEFLRLYISPLQEKVFKDYEVYPPRTDQAFVVRYSADDQRELKPHFDESTYTLNIALNTPHKDFEGGGCRFTRFNCSVVDTRLGWGFVHPGQFTHKHEGLKVTNGTRYILVSFIDPQHEFDE